MTSIGSVSCGRTAKRSTSRSWTTTEGGTMPRKARRLPPVHPGELLKEDLLKPLGISINRLGRDLRVPVTRVSEIVNGRRGITADTALRLARYFSTTPEFWMNLQATYDLASVHRALAHRIARDVHPRAAPYGPSFLCPH